MRCVTYAHTHTNAHFHDLYDLCYLYYVLGML